MLGKAIRWIGNALCCLVQPAKNAMQERGRELVGVTERADGGRKPEDRTERAAGEEEAAAHLDGR